MRTTGREGGAAGLEAPRGLVRGHLRVYIVRGVAPCRRRPQPRSLEAGNRETPGVELQGCARTAADVVGPVAVLQPGLHYFGRRLVQAGR